MVESVDDAFLVWAQDDMNDNRTIVVRKYLIICILFSLLNILKSSKKIESIFAIRKLIMHESYYLYDKFDNDTLRDLNICLYTIILYIYVLDE